ncbi:unnamed protein product [Chrysoparadoxa australica]
MKWLVEALRYVLGSISRRKETSEATQDIPQSLHQPLHLHAHLAGALLNLHLPVTKALEVLEKEGRAYLVSSSDQCHSAFHCLNVLEAKKRSYACCLVHKR